jgi:hypothetical protein
MESKGNLWSIPESDFPHLLRTEDKWDPNPGFLFLKNMADIYFRGIKNILSDVKRK